MFEKAENKAKEFSGAAQEKLGELTGSAEHQAKGAAKKIRNSGKWGSARCCGRRQGTS